MLGYGRSAEQARSRLAQTGRALYLVDAAGRIRYWSPSIAELCGVPAEDVLNRSAVDVFPCLRLNRGWHDLIAALNGWPSRRRAFFSHPPSQYWAFQQVSRTPIIHGGNVVGALVMIEWSKRWAPFNWDDMDLEASSS